MKQRTLRDTYQFEGKGLHTGLYSHMSVCPGPENSGIVFFRNDLGKEIPALAGNVCSTSRSTMLSCGKTKVRTIEHIMSALTGLGIDNARVEIDGPEIPILDGSARAYAESLGSDPLVEQGAERKWLEISREVTVSNDRTGSWIKIVPADDFELECTIDFNSRVLGVQTARWNTSGDYSSMVAPCRTFCFLHEILPMASLGLVKGGDVENAIVVVEKSVSSLKLRMLSRLFRQPFLSVTPEGYLSNLSLRFPDECGRHKLLDLIGDIRLCGGFPKVHIQAYKPGHALNTKAAGILSKMFE